MSDSFVTPWTVDHSPTGSSVYRILQARLCSELPFPSAGDLPDPGIKSGSPESLALTGGFFFFFLRVEINVFKI